ncbi:ABC transporter permease [Fodinicola acaciae]|uniref:ABC transporter permease n=1 Tax=Fodinicola acaciae TaxID=2681555 RepID=UPI0013D33448|nr:ABC transporter permease [Fodinicola acaciae]
MSAAETLARPQWTPRPVSPRLLLSELRLVYGRRRNQAVLAVLAVVPILIAVAVKINSADGRGPVFFNSIAQNGLFVSLAALFAITPLFLPLAVAVVSGDAVAGEANQGTLRYLLTVPVNRVRLLVTKYAAAVIFCFSATLLVGVVGAVVGLVLFPSGSVLMLSGTTAPLSEAMLRILYVCLYLGLCMSALAAIGMFISTLTDYPVAAMAATAGLAVASEVLDQIPQLSALAPWLPTHWWFSFGDFLRDPITMQDSLTGVVSALVYIAIFGSLAWARFAGKDVSS